ncbi:hypothetical protein SCLCIDRAFT_101513 [Scleroderma citrinum Foug A]|uniref:Thioredoxin domain-containing protein n=1 Tax=Scleroderma citrinum Foug A TaxID=1036808 RepID=A0A0C3A993_9AGAM|nr:hypothetical protein SCLCIDRAFT_101513 [Scleroderma citrinum Foug A]
MPLEEVELPFDTDSLKNGRNRFIVFFSSRVDGRLWCPDCVAVEGLVNNTFRPEHGQYYGVLVYVGQKAEWKSENCIFRREPWCITAIPTIMKLDKARHPSTFRYIY